MKTLQNYNGHSINNNDRIIYNDNDNNNNLTSSMSLDVFLYDTQTHLNYCFFSMNLVICSKLRDQYMKDFSGSYKGIHY